MGERRRRCKREIIPRGVRGREVPGRGFGGRSPLKGSRAHPYSSSLAVTVRTTGFTGFSLCWVQGRSPLVSTKWSAKHVLSREPPYMSQMKPDQAVKARGANRLADSHSSLADSM